MTIYSLSNEELVTQTLSTIKLERSQTTQVIRLFEEISRRKLYLDYAYPSLYEMAIHHFGYCAGSAMRRIDAMKMIREIPEVAEKIESGELSLSVVSEVQSFFYQEAKSERPYSISAKIELIEKSVGMSKREVERELANRNPERDKRETSYSVSNDRLRVSFTISQELNDKLNRLKDLLGHVDANMTTESLLERLAEYGLDKHDPKRRAERAKARSAKAAAAPRDPAPKKKAGQRENSVPPAEVMIHSKARSRYIKSRDRNQVTDDGQGCTHIDSKTNRRCGSKKFLELDHIEPFANGGPNTAQNLRWMCGAHNRLRAT